MRNKIQESRERAKQRTTSGLARVAIRLPSAHQDHRSKLGAYYVGDSLQLLESAPFKRLKGQVQLVMTSPPFPLNQKKSYGNRNGEAYLRWFRRLAPILSELIADNGSIVIELGNSWEPGRPVQSLLTMKALMALVGSSKAKLRLIQEFVCYNPSRLPSPASWVTVDRIRMVDSFTHVWWLAKSDYPKADNSRVLRPYSNAMKALLKRGTYNGGLRPSEHRIGKSSFAVAHRGAISHNFLELEPLDERRKVRLPNAFSLSNTASNDLFHATCKARKLTPHPARMPQGLVGFFIDFLTTKGDLVVDPFAGSNTTGYVAALKQRRWISIEANKAYAEQSQIRLQDPLITKNRGSR